LPLIDNLPLAQLSSGGSALALACFLNAMHEEILKRFFDGELVAAALAEDLVDSMVMSGNITNHPTEDMSKSFRVCPEHLTLLCDAVLRGEIEPKHLQAIGFCIIASDNFEYDPDTSEGDLVDDIVSAWSVPEINYPLNRENVKKFREWLVSGSDPFALSTAS
jgi:hypothetical protein